MAKHILRKRKASEELSAEDFMEEDVYTIEGREDLLDSDEINDWEAGFMEGYEE